jgi:alcohol dehydrogenase (NADP+)
MALLRPKRHWRRSSSSGVSPRETQEMLDFCAKHGVASNVEVIPIQQINKAYERIMKCDVRYRFVIDIASLKRPQAMPRWDQERYNVSANSNHAYW